MSAIANTRSTHAAAPVAGTITRLIAAFTAWNDARATRKALSALSDRELEDIGLSRSDIDSISARG
ncbi:DUF1127 domain-containing protein [Roseovarius sp. ZX-A-9]|uniref:DUF1127 domain-containing protein n=1 Tax=Roseovarius sp. ZX-A-9 TaxID=3014783 RepID=UPI002331104A|nr:DUF1127 domain-containing protein [Roseovarius sp. ZX-A-9]MDX1784977.1 DUF1127 domain-containing protein [Roseovarius sp.]